MPHRLFKLSFCATVFCLSLPFLKPHLRLKFWSEETSIFWLLTISDRRFSWSLVHQSARSFTAAIILLLHNFSRPLPLTRTAELVGSVFRNSLMSPPGVHPLLGNSLKSFLKEYFFSQDF